MNHVYLIIAIMLVGSTAITSVHAVSEPIPAWVKGVAGFWAEDKITDKEFIEALEFLIESNIIKASDPRVLLLEKENQELKQEIESLESENIPQQDTANIIQPLEENEMTYVTTDKQEYGLGDVIQVSGFIDRSILDNQSIDQRLNKTITRYDKSLIDIYVSFDDSLYGGGYHSDVISCERAQSFVDNGNFIHNYNQEQKKYILTNFEMNEFYPIITLDILDNGYPDVIQRCFDDQGNFEFSFMVDDEYYAGEYKVYFSDRAQFSSSKHIITIK